MSRTLTLVAPPGYGAVTPLDTRKHAGMGVAPDVGQAWMREINAVFINAAEMFKAALDYPIAFVREASSGEFVPMAILGLQAKQNLYVDAAGHWRAQTYVPAYVRRYPFCIALTGGSDAAPQHLVCVRESALSPRSKQPLFTVNGEPTPAWAPINQLLEAMEGARQQTRVLTRRLEALELLVPFEAVAVPKRGERSRLKGLYRVDEEKLAALTPRDMKTLQRKGELRAVYAHLLSLENFARLLTWSQEQA